MEDVKWERRILPILNHLGPNGKPQQTYRLHIEQNPSSASDECAVSIGDVTLIVEKPKRPELVPFDVAAPKTGLEYDAEDIQEIVQHLRWMMQKEKLNQDMFLIGPPGPYKRWLALRYCELTRREIEYLALSRDTSEADIKQRKEIVNRSVVFVDQGPVKAAIEGRVLILDGIEKCERNVLPVLNNLLENREMNLDDGRFLVSAPRYESLRKNHSAEQLEAMKLVKVHPKFRVIALGLPVPRFPGNPLDPPLRSRFQARDIHALTTESLFSLLTSESKVPINLIRKLLSLVQTLRTMESGERKDLFPRLPHFPSFAVHAIVDLMEVFPELEIARLISRVFPYRLVCDKSEEAAIQTFLKSQGFLEFQHHPEKEQTHYKLKNLQANTSKDESERFAEATFVSKSGNIVDLELRCGNSDQKELDAHYVDLGFTHHILVGLLQDHTIGKDVCLVGERGSGKSALIHEFSRTLNYNSENTFVIQLYNDMTARDLIQRRITKENGDTEWEHAPLIRAALSGGLAVLDGVHRLHRGTLAVIQRLVHDREITLFDGTRLIRKDRHLQILSETGWSKEELHQKKILPVHPSFRLVALAIPPNLKNPWLTSEVISMFHFHFLHDLKAAEKEALLRRLFPDSPIIENLLLFASKVHDWNISQKEGAKLGLSLRQLIRIAKHASAYPADLYDAIHRTLLTRFMPFTLRQPLESILSQISLKPPAARATSEHVPVIEISNNTVIIDDVKIQIRDSQHPELIPEVLFFDMPKHVQILKEMMKDYELGEHLLLIGNQGVGKNKLADKMLQLLRMEREYIQLHRDTTVMSLTLIPVVENGILRWEDSPLVRAVKEGRVLMIDEADKAPLEVVCILKGLAQDSEMLLSDGRRISGFLPAGNSDQNGKVIKIHPNFRMIVLANRPGFPFLGNDFFAECGDCFSCFPVDNPDEESELYLLKQYAPHVSDETLKNLTNLFADLRKLVDEGLLSYPYSLRELVNIVRHLEEFDNDGLLNAAANVYSFDLYDAQLREHLRKTFHKHGIPIGALYKDFSVALAKEELLPPMEITDTWTVERDQQVLVDSQPVPLKGQLSFKKVVNPLGGRTTGRLLTFNEKKYSWTVESPGEATAVETLEDGSLVVLIEDPLTVHIYPQDSSKNHSSYFVVDLQGFFPFYASDLRSFHRVFPNPTLFALPSNRIGVFIPLYNLLCVIEPKVATIHLFELSFFGGSSSSFFKDHVLMASPRPNPAVDVILKTKTASELSRSGLVVYYQTGVNFLVAVNTSSMQSQIVKLPISAENVFVLSPTSLLIKSSSGGLHFFDFTASTLQNITRKNSANPPFIFARRSANSILANSPHTIFQRTSVENDQMTLSSCQRTSPDRTKSSLHLKNGGLLNLLNTSLEVVDFKRGILRRYYDDPSTKAVPVIIGAAELPNGDVAVLREGNQLEVLEIDPARLAHSKNNWQKIIGGNNENERLSIKISGNKNPTPAIKSGGPVGKSSEGIVDPTGKPHVGGNTFQGGSGGRSTAGLGGKGGPFRKASGHKVEQISEEEKREIHEQILAEAREMSKKALQQKLKEIEMNEPDSAMYERYMSQIGREISSLRVILEGVEAKAKERLWTGNQLSGDFDDRKTVEAITGEKNIYKKRVEQDPQPGTIQEKPKRIRFAMDISGSMYRFNGDDKRLERLILFTLMIMESFHGFEHKYSYSIVGHSGDGPEIPLVDYGKAPSNRQQRMKVLQRMVAHSEHCQNGDTTVEAIQKAVKNVAEVEADDYFVFAISDANLKRYGISVRDLSSSLTKDPKVSAFCVFIASVNEEADQLRLLLPVGKAFTCLDTSKLPGLFKQIFESKMLS